MVFNQLQAALERHAAITLHQGKTRVWNAGGEEPLHLSRLQPVESERVWVGDWNLPAQEQGLTVLGTPLGAPAYVQRELATKQEGQSALLRAIPSLTDLQVAFLLLLFCACPRANYVLRVLPPSLTAGYAQAHDAAVANCAWPPFSLPARRFLTYRSGAPAYPLASVALACDRPTTHAMRLFGPPGQTASRPYTSASHP